MTPANRVTLAFSSSRTDGGDDIAELIRKLDEDANIVAMLDDAGALAGYSWTVDFPTADACTEAIFRLRDVLAARGIEHAFDVTITGLEAESE